MATEHADIQPTPDLLAVFGAQDAVRASHPVEPQATRALEVGARVRSARTRAGIKAVDLARLLGLDRDKLSKIENGRRRIAPKELPRLAAALGVSIQYLLEGRVSEGPALAFRVAHPDAQLSRARQRAADILDADARLARARCVAPATPTPEAAGVLAAAAAVAQRTPRTKSEAQRQGRDLARETRQLLDLGSSEIGDLPGLIEQHFAADVALSPVGENVSGLCAHTPDQALLLANSDCTAGHVRFTLGHELAHHLFGDPRDVIEESPGDLYSSNFIERRASAFAAYLLLPERGVRRDLAWFNVTPGDLTSASAAGRRALGYLMAKYGVSLPCAVYQLAAFNLLTFGQAEDLKSRVRAGEVLQDAAGLLPARGDITVATRETRVPTRLADGGWKAAREGKVGLGTLSRLLDRGDDGQLFEAVFGGDGADEAGSGAAGSR